MAFVGKDDLSLPALTKTQKKIFGWSTSVWSEPNTPRLPVSFSYGTLVRWLWTDMFTELFTAHADTQSPRKNTSLYSLILWADLFVGIHIELLWSERGLVVSTWDDLTRLTVTVYDGHRDTEDTGYWWHWETAGNYNPVMVRSSKTESHNIQISSGSSVPREVLMLYYDRMPNYSGCYYYLPNYSHNWLVL